MNATVLFRTEPGKAKTVTAVIEPTSKFRHMKETNLHSMKGRIEMAKRIRDQWMQNGQIPPQTVWHIAPDFKLTNGRVK